MKSRFDACIQWMGSRRPGARSFLDFPVVRSLIAAGVFEAGGFHDRPSKDVSYTYELGCLLNHWFGAGLEWAADELPYWSRISLKDMAGPADIEHGKLIPPVSLDRDVLCWDPAGLDDVYVGIFVMEPHSVLSGVADLSDREDMTMQFRALAHENRPVLEFRYGPGLASGFEDYVTNNPDGSRAIHVDKILSRYRQVKEGRK